jgi:HsdM N-terminal domain/N-6 DNA Methylase
VARVKKAVVKAAARTSLRRAATADTHPKLAHIRPDETPTKTLRPKKANGGELNFEATLWSAADTLRGSMDASEYKHVVLGLIFSKYISDSFEELHAKLAADPEADPEDRLEYTAQNAFWVPVEARWSGIAAKAKSPQIGSLIDKAMIAIEQDNPALKGVLPKEYARPALDPARLGAIVDLVSTIGLGDAESRKKDILGRVYEYFLGRFANAEGKAGGEFYTPRVGFQFITQNISEIRKDIVKNLHYRVYAQGLSVGSDADLIKDLEGDEAFKMYGTLPEPRLSGTFSYMVCGMILALGTTGKPMFIEGFSSDAEIMAQNGLTYEPREPQDDSLDAHFFESTPEFME